MVRGARLREVILGDGLKLDRKHVMSKLKTLTTLQLHSSENSEFVVSA
jgi:hypothetical protein